MNSRMLTFLAILPLAMGLAGCQTVRTAPARGGENVQTRTLLPVPASRSQEGSGAVLMAVEFKGIDDDDRDDSCRWRFVNKDSGKSYFITFELDDSHGVAQLEPGHYEAGRFGCGLGHVWDLDQTFPGGFSVEAGHLSYLGKVIFEFKDGDLDHIHLSSRTESALGFVDAIESSETLRKWPAISGFTGKPIDRTMYDNGEARDGFDVFAKGVEQPTVHLNPLLLSLSACAKEEGSSDPLRFGRLEYTAIYRDGRFTEMRDRREANGFSDRLRSCVERGMMAFHPEKKSEVEVRVRY